MLLKGVILSETYGNIGWMPEYKHVVQNLRSKFKIRYALKYTIFHSLVINVYSTSVCLDWCVYCWYIFFVFLLYHCNQKIYNKVYEIARGILFDNVIDDNDMTMIIVFFLIGYYCSIDLQYPHKGSL